MLALADFSNEEGECFPSVSTLAEKSRVSERHVQKVISHLQQHGLVTVEKGAGRGRIPGQRSNLYRINLDQLRSNAPIPAPNYKEQNEKKREDKADRIHPRHNDTPTPGTMTPVGVAYAQKTGVIMPPEPSLLEPSKETTTTTRNLSKSNGAVKTSVVVVASSWPDNDDEPAEIVEKLTEKLKLSYDQSNKVQFYLDQDGKGYVLEKAALTRSKDLRNAGGFFIRALEKDYREPVTNTKPSPPPKKKRVEPKPEEPPVTDEERAQTSAKLREFIQTLRASR
jgi:hypothetical protein